MKLTLLGTAGSEMVPVYGCECSVCTQAQNDPSLRREKASALLEHNGHKLLLDANAPDLLKRFPSGSIDTILLTHYHMDHVISLFDLRTGKGPTIPVFSPDDPLGCDDLYKHPGCLDFSSRAKPFEPFHWQEITITPLPLIHSKLCLGYGFEYQDKCFAYLTDTNGLPPETEAWLAQRNVEWMIIDCSFPPIECEQLRLSQNHNDINQILDISERCRPANMGLTHLSHTLLEWAHAHPDFFNQSLHLLRDNQEIKI